MDKMDIIDNAGLIEDTVTAIDAISAEIEREASLSKKCPTVGYYMIAIHAMLDKIREYSSVIQKAAE